MPKIAGNGPPEYLGILDLQGSGITRPRCRFLLIIPGNAVHPPARSDSWGQTPKPGVDLHILTGIHFSTYPAISVDYFDTLIVKK
jgi:hypothetical protein